MDDIEGLSEALQGLQAALDRVKELLPTDSAEEQGESIDSSTEESAEHSAGDPGPIKPSVADAPGGGGDDMNKASAAEAIRRLLG